MRAVFILLVMLLLGCGQQKATPPEPPLLDAIESPDDGVSFGGVVVVKAKCNKARAEWLINRPKFEGPVYRVYDVAYQRGVQIAALNRQIDSIERALKTTCLEHP